MLAHEVRAVHAQAWCAHVAIFEALQMAREHGNHVGVVHGCRVGLARTVKHSAMPVRVEAVAICLRVCAQPDGEVVGAVGDGRRAAEEAAELEATASAARHVRGMGRGWTLTLQSDDSELLTLVWNVSDTLHRHSSTAAVATLLLL